MPEELRRQFQRVTTIDGLEVYENTQAWPRARLVGGAQVLPSPEDIYERLNDTGFRPEKTVLLEEPLQNALPQEGAAEPGDARFTGRTMNTATVEVDAKSSCLLVFADQYFPGWNAYVDGTKSKVLSAYYAFRAVEISPGKHTIVFRYEPSSFKIGMTISIMALLLGSGGALLALKRTHRLPPAPKLD